MKNKKITAIAISFIVLGILVVGGLLVATKKMGFINLPFYGEINNKYVLPLGGDSKKSGVTNGLLSTNDRVLKIWPLSSVPDGIQKNVKVNVCFTSIITGEDALKIKALVLNSVDKNGKTLKIMGNLKDDGQSCDLAKDDLVFSGQSEIGPTQDDALYFRAYAELPNEGKFQSNTYSLAVSGLPTELSPSDMSKITVDQETGNKMLSNEVLVNFTAGTPEKKIETIAKSVGGQIVGSIMGLGIFQIRFSGTGDAVGVKNIISALKKFQEVKTAEPNYVTTID